MAPGCFHLSTIKPATRPKVSYCHFHHCTLDGKWWSLFGTDTEHLDHCTILHAQRFGTVGMLGVGLLKQEPPQNGRIQFGRPFETIQEGLPNLETPLQMSRTNIVAVSKKKHLQSPGLPQLFMQMCGVVCGTDPSNLGILFF